MENREVETAKKYAIVRANLIAMGFMEETEEGLKITNKGKIVARKKWMELPDEDKLLYGWLTRSLYDMGRL